ncbi:MAG: transcriptional regulator [Chloroflexi bacterium]|nr:transcriptional regulator [Chloroflexota bacterium]
MTNPFENLANLDRLIHEPARLSIMTALSVVQSADFTFLKNITGLSVGNLSNHLAKLEEGGFIQITKGFVKNRPNTMITITAQGSRAIEIHWMRLKSLYEESKKLKKG